MAVMTGDIAALVAKAGHSVDLERPSKSEDELGGRNRIWATQTAAIACWVQPASASTIAWYGERGITVTHTVYFATAPGAQTGDRFKFGTRYMVIEGVQNVAETSELWEVDCREVQAVT